jgi:hypothetical protein
VTIYRMLLYVISVLQTNKQKIRQKTKGSYWLIWSHHLKSLWSTPWLGLLLWNICITNDHGCVPPVANTFRSFTHSWLITRVATSGAGTATLPQHLTSPPVFSGVYVTWSLALSVMFCRSWLVLLAIVLSVLRFTDSDYPFGIFKLFFD